MLSVRNIRATKVVDVDYGSHSCENDNSSRFVTPEFQNFLKFLANKNSLTMLEGFISSTTGINKAMLEHPYLEILHSNLRMTPKEVSALSHSPYGHCVKVWAAEVLHRVLLQASRYYHLEEYQLKDLARGFSDQVFGLHKEEHCDLLSSQSIQHLERLLSHFQLKNSDRPFRINAGIIAKHIRALLDDTLYFFRHAEQQKFCLLLTFHGANQGTLFSLPEKQIHTNVKSKDSIQMFPSQLVKEILEDVRKINYVHIEKLGTAEQNARKEIWGAMANLQKEISEHLERVRAYPKHPWYYIHSKAVQLFHFMITIPRLSKERKILKQLDRAYLDSISLGSCTQFFNELETMSKIYHNSRNSKLFATLHEIKDSYREISHIEYVESVRNCTSLPLSIPISHAVGVQSPHRESKSLRARVYRFFRGPQNLGASSGGALTSGKKDRKKRELRFPIQARIQNLGFKPKGTPALPATLTASSDRDHISSSNDNNLRLCLVKKQKSGYRNAFVVKNFKSWAQKVIFSRSIPLSSNAYKARSLQKRSSLCTHRRRCKLLYGMSMDCVDQILDRKPFHANTPSQPRNNNPLRNSLSLEEVSATSCHRDINTPACVSSVSVDTPSTLGRVGLKKKLKRPLNTNTPKSFHDNDNLSCDSLSSRGAVSLLSVSPTQKVTKRKKKLTRKFWKPFSQCATTPRLSHNNDNLSCDSLSSGRESVSPSSVSPPSKAAKRKKKLTRKFWKPFSQRTAAPRLSSSNNSLLLSCDSLSSRVAVSPLGASSHRKVSKGKKKFMRKFWKPFSQCTTAPRLSSSNDSLLLSYDSLFYGDVFSPSTSVPTLPSIVEAGSEGRSTATLSSSSAQKRH